MSDEKKVDAVLSAPGAPAALAKLDYSTADASKVKGILSGFDFGALLKDPKVVFFVIDLVNKLIDKFNKPKPVDPPVVTGPNGPVIVPPPPVAPPPTARIITSLRAKFYFVERKGKVLPKNEFDAIISRQDPLQRGDRVHLDVSPYDQFGREIITDSPELEQLVNRETEPPSLRLRWLQPQDGVGEITNEYDDYGMTPVYKVPKNLEVGQQYELGTFALEFTPEGVTHPIVSNELHSLRVRPWVE